MAGNALGTLLFRDVPLMFYDKVMSSAEKLRKASVGAMRRVVSFLTLKRNVGVFSLLLAIFSNAAFADDAKSIENVSNDALRMFRIDEERNASKGEESPRFVETALRKIGQFREEGKLSAYASEETETLEAAAEDRNESDEDDARLLANIRPFKRARERIFGEERVFKDLASPAPEPPVVETINPEEQEKKNVVVPAKPPVISLASAELPPLDPVGARAASEELATRAEVEALREESKGLAWKKGDLKITPYGFLNLSVSTDTERAVPGEYILYLQNPNIDSSSDFAVDARTSRLGLKIEGPRIERLDATLGGVAEFDFQGVVSGSKNKGGVQLRRAFAELVDARHERRFLAGQDWEIISPGAPMMLNYLPGAFAGNIQYRRAQLRFEQGWSCSSDLHFLGQIAVCDNVLGDYTSTAGVTPMTSGWPVLEGRLATTLFNCSRNGLPITVGVSGHIGEQYYKFSPIAGVPLASTAERKSIRTWSANVDYDVPITETLKFQGEYYYGSVLSSFCGAINQGVDLYRRAGIDDQGWWVGIRKDWSKQFCTNVGYGIDRPEKADLVGTSVASNGLATARTKNEIYFVNFVYNWSANFMNGIEFSYWQTDWQTKNVLSESPEIVSEDTAKALRVEFVTRLSF